MPFVDDADLQEFDEEPFPVIGSDLLHGSDDDENPIDSAPTVIQKFDDEVPATAAQLGDESDDASNEKNGVGQDNETDDDEDIPNVPKNMSQPGSSKKASRPSLDISRGSTPKTPEPDKAATSSSSRKRKAGHLESPDIKRPGRATAAAASEAIKAATAKRPKAVPGSNAKKETGAKRRLKPGPKPQKEVSVEEFEVEAIRDVDASGNDFLVKWKGYGEKENTWEPRENLVHAAELLKEFETKNKENGEEAKKPLRAKKSSAGDVKSKTKAKKAAPAKKSATTKPATTSRSRSGRLKRN